MNRTKCFFALILILGLLMCAALATTISCDSASAGDDDDDGQDGDDDTANDDSDDDDDTDSDDDDDTTSINYALEFNGEDAYAVVPDSTSLDVTTSMTIEAWIYIRSVDSSGWNNLVGHYSYQSGEVNQGWLLRIGYGKLRFEIMDNFNNYTQASADAPLNQWIHVAGTFDGEAIRLWVNGVKVDETLYSSIIGQAFTNLYMGMRHSSVYFFDGMIDEIRLSSVAQYDANFSPDTELIANIHTLGLWHFDEGTGSIAYDESINGNHGTLHGPTWIER